MHKTKTQIETFDQWFASYLGESEIEITRLLQDKTAVQFLIAWSLLESKSFSGFLKKKEIASYAQKITDSEDFEIAEIRQIGMYFHERYQDETRRKQLLHKDNCAIFDNILKKPFDRLDEYEVVYLVVYVVYRYRNNIFHGNKKVASWLHYKQQIIYCTHAMQALVTHNKSQERTE